MEEHATYEELAHRTTDALDVWLLWSRAEDRLAVQVSDAKSGDFFEVDSERDRALDVFRHPYAYAAVQGAKPLN